MTFEEYKLRCDDVELVGCYEISFADIEFSKMFEK